MRETFKASQVEALTGITGRELGQHRRRVRLPARTSRKCTVAELTALAAWGEINRLHPLHGNRSIRCFEMAEEQAAALLDSPDAWLFIAVLDADHPADGDFLATNADLALAADEYGGLRAMCIIPLGAALSSLRSKLTPEAATPALRLAA